MARRSNPDLSALESEYEFEMESDDEAKDDFEAGDQELDQELDDAEVDDEFEDSDSESGDDGEFEFSDRDAGGSQFAQRFIELAQQEFETEFERDRAIDEVLSEMEQEYFFGRLKKLAKSAMRHPGLRALISQAKKLAGNHPAFAAFKGLTALTRGDLKGLLRSAASAGLGALKAHPAAALAMGALKGLNFKPEAAPEENQEAWENFVGAARESFEYLANNVSPATRTPAAAARLATSAFSAGMQRATSGSQSSMSSLGVRPGRRRRVVLRPGDRLLIVCRRS